MSIRNASTVDVNDWDDTPEDRFWLVDTELSEYEGPDEDLVPL